MFKIATVVFRECLEIALILSIIMAATKPIRNSRIYIILGSMLGIVFSAIFAFFLRSIHNSFANLGDEMFNIFIILITSFMIAITVVWVQGYTRKFKKKLDILSNKISTGVMSHFMIIVVVSTSIMREGIEIILLLHGIIAKEPVSASHYLIGLTIGGFSGLVVGNIIYLGLIKYSGKYIFTILTILLTLISAGLAAKAAVILTSTGIVESYNNQIWDSSIIIANDSIVGKILNITVGYDSKPNVLQIIFYFTTILIILAMIRIKKQRETQHA